MPISVSCPECKATYNVVDQLSGKRVHCQQCRAVFLVPEARWEALVADEVAIRPEPPPAAPLNRGGNLPLPPRASDPRPWQPSLPAQRPKATKPQGKPASVIGTILTIVIGIAVAIFFANRGPSKRAAFFTKPIFTRPALFQKPPPMFDPPPDGKDGRGGAGGIGGGGR